MKEGRKRGEVGNGGKHVHAFLDDDTYLRFKRLAALYDFELGEMLQHTIAEFLKQNYTEKRIKELLNESLNSR